LDSPTAAIVAALAQSPVLGVLDPAAQARLAASGGPVELAAGALLFQAGDAGDAAFVVLSGELEVRTQGLDGRELRIGALKSGAVVGEMAVVDGAPRSADVCATRKSRLWRVPRAALIAALEADPKTALALMAELSRRLRAANAALEASRMLDLGGRLALLLLAEQPARGAIALTQTEMARRLGFSREKVNRKLHDWAGRGWIELLASGVRIVDPDRLSELLGGKRAG
jgi:CRP-like cAMP-binding protein